MKFKIAVLLLFVTTSLSAQLDRSKQPEPGPAPEITLGDYKSFTMDNGLKVFVIENRKIPKINFSLILDRDPILEKEKVGYISMAGQLLRRGTKTRSKIQLDEEIDFIGANFNTSGNSISGSSLTKHFNKLMELFSDVLLNSEFKNEELEKIKKQMISGLAAEKEDPNAISANLRSVLLYGKDHPYGEVLTEESVKAVTLNDCLEYYKNYFVPNISYLVFVGDIDVDSAKKLASKFLAGWIKKEVKKKEYGAPKHPTTSKVSISDRASSVQSVIKIAYPANLKKDSEDLIKASVMNTILGGTFSARLNKNLREEKGFTYGAGSSLNSDKLVGSFTASATVRNSVTDSAISEIFYEMEKLRIEMVQDDELQRIKSYLNGSFSRALENPQTIARFALNIERYNLSKDYYKNYLKNLSEVNADNVLAMAKKYLKPNNAHIIVVGNAHEIAESLKKFSKKNKIFYYDNYGNEYNKESLKVGEGITPEIIIDKYINAIGDRERLSAITDKTMKLEGIVDGMNVELTMIQKTPNKLFQELNFTVGKQTTIFNGEKGKIEGMGQVLILEGEKLEELKNQAIVNPFLYYKENKVKLELVGMENINGIPAYKIITTSTNDKKTSHYYDKESNLKIREVSSVTSPKGTFSQIIDMSDYREIDGIRFPHKLIQDMGPRAIELNVTSIEVNSGIDDSIFEIN